MKKVVLYGRISSSDESLESQFVLLREIAAQRGFEIAGVSSDLASCSSKTKRAGIEALLRDARRGVFSAVLTSGLDRLGTSVKNCMELVREFDTLGVELISAKEAVDTTSPTGRVFVETLFCLQELHKSHNRERIKGGMRRRKLDGQPIGRALLSVDYDSLVRDRLSGMSLTDVARKYSISRASVVRFVRQAKQSNSGRFAPFIVTQEQAEVCAA
jgi:DNA invertase Pin-like site-specific DNA recombinase